MNTRESSNIPGKAVRWFVTILVPVVLVLTNVRLLLTHAFVEIEYRTPGFPADPYGFTQEDRLHWSQLSLDYLLNDSGIEFLGSQHFADGAPIYNERELRHMADVKQVVQGALRVWIASLALVLVLSLAQWFGWDKRAAIEGLRGGAILTLILFAALAIGVVAAFSAVFVEFHRVFFEGDTWLFSYADTLIRLFPERFWQDAFTFLAAATLIEAGLVFWLTRRSLRRQA
ncbi:MAG TPA: TIGR01906 family membrane protein [Anaerolineales bacterium]|nr:TIGR01906 family membrane protein [Anaerolineales bacterium]